MLSNTVAGYASRICICWYHHTSKEVWDNRIMHRPPPLDHFVSKTAKQLQHLFMLLVFIPIDFKVLWRNINCHWLFENQCVTFVMLLVEFSKGTTHSWSMVILFLIYYQLFHLGFSLIFVLFLFPFLPLQSATVSHGFTMVLASRWHHDADRSAVRLRRFLDDNDDKQGLKKVIWLSFSNPINWHLSNVIVTS